jgi:hypothetical protein
MISGKTNLKKTVIVRQFSIFSYSQYGLGNLHALQAALLLLPERLGKVPRHTTSRTPIPSLLGCLLNESEASQLTLRLWSTH